MSTVTSEVKLLSVFQDRYRELLRISRQWRDLHDCMRAGVAHDRNTGLIPGAIAIFCPACPQVGINIPPEREWRQEDRYVTIIHHFMNKELNRVGSSIVRRWSLMEI